MNQLLNHVFFIRVYELNLNKGSVKKLDYYKDIKKKSSIKVNLRERLVMNK